MFRKVGGGALGSLVLLGVVLGVGGEALATVNTADIADGAVTTPKIANGAVTNAKIAAGAVGTGKIAEGAVTSAKISNVAAGKITGKVVASQIAGGSGSGLDADTVDGHHASDFVTAATINALQAQVNTLIAQVAALQAKLAKVSVSADGNTIIVSNANLQIINGSGATYGEINGTGNLIIGYNENCWMDYVYTGDWVCQTRTGSHNLVIGPYHSYSSYGGLVAGGYNTISAPYTTVSGGDHNTASEYFSSVSGGVYNLACGEESSVSGGGFNSASGSNASVSGGIANTASGWAASVSGGGGWDDYMWPLGNTASGNYSSVSGGQKRSATGDGKWVGGSYSSPN